MSSGTTGSRLASLAGRPAAVLVTGESRPVLNRVLFAMALANDPAFAWVDLRPRAERLDSDSPTELGWIPAERLFVIQESEDARPQDAVGNLALASLVRADDPKNSLSRLADLVRLPAVAQEAIGSLRGRTGRRVIAFPNGDYVRRYYGPDPPTIRPFLETFLADETSPFFASVSTPAEARQAFDFVFEVRAESRARWRTGTLHCEKVPRWARFHAGENVPLREIPEVVRAMD